MPKIPKKPISRTQRFQEHVQTWKSCTSCKLSDCRSKVVLYRGNIPADILFVGEAPGFSEDLLGVPFAGPAGHLLDDIVREVLRICDAEALKTGFTNSVACIPKDPENPSEKVKEPDEEAILACLPRFYEILELVSPKIVVSVGSVASTFLNRQDIYYKLPAISQRNIIKITHPAAIMRAPKTSHAYLIQKEVDEFCSRMRSSIDCIRAYEEDGEPAQLSEDDIPF